jgi:hypothetical protein
MKKLLILLFILVSSISFAQNAAKLEGTWRNQEGEVLEMGWKVFQRQTTKGLIKGTWEEVDENTLRIIRSTGEEYQIDFAVTGTTFVIEQPFTDKTWLWYRMY